ncbi:hypothetical protein [Nocardioides sp. SR21]|uniref:hypothetical protein n=1 Tax=Nocardioides sp. SR21 TaxID=2919501 RepID=UPI001FAACC44|nr:hypothetical protein [Nocardioides sp. SR21]
MAHIVNDDLVAFVRTTEGGTVKLHAGDTVPAEADADHVAALTERGVLAEVEERTAPEPKTGNKPGAKN